MGTNGRKASPWRRRLYVPAYTTAEAARLAQAAPQTVAYWHYGGRTAVGPTLSTKRRREALSYLQLVEVAFVSTFRHIGVSLQRIRKAREYAAQRFNVEFPFAQYEFKTDGVHVLMDLAEEEPSFNFLIAADEHGQTGWREVLLSRFDEFDYDHGLALTWHPRGRETPIVVDARVAFGAPIVAGTGIPTWVLRGRIEAGETSAEIEEEFGIREPALRTALEFEGVRLAA